MSEALKYFGPENLGQAMEVDVVQVVRDSVTDGGVVVEDDFAELLIPVTPKIIVEMSELGGTITYWPPGAKAFTIGFS